MWSSLFQRFRSSTGRVRIPRGRNVPRHWDKNSWEEKAQENPLFAVMTTPDLIDADANEFSEEHLEPFFEKGQRVYTTHVEPCIKRSNFSQDECHLVEYGCGVGRILRSVVANGYKCSGIDISETMLNHCARLVPGIDSLHLLDKEGRCDLPSDVGTVVFSFAVFKHISKLSRYIVALSEMCRLVKPDGMLALNVNSQDFIDGDLNRPGRTENFENYSLHYQPGSKTSYKKRISTNWSGVYIGIDLLRDRLNENQIEILDIYHHSATKKPQGIWVIGRKAA